MTLNQFTEYKDIVYRIIGAAMEVHRECGWGLLEAIYNEALHIELTERGIKNQQEQKIPCFYKGRLLDKYYQADISVQDIIIEIKSVKEFTPQHTKQLLNYLRLTQTPIGLLLNFGQERLQCHRYGWDKKTNRCHLLDVNLNVLWGNENQD